MNEKKSADNGSKTGKGFKLFAFKRLAGGLLLLIAALWALGVLLGYFKNPSPLVARNSSSQSQPVLKTAKPPAGKEKPGASSLTAERTADGHTTKVEENTKEKRKVAVTHHEQNDQEQSQQSAARHAEPPASNTAHSPAAAHISSTTTQTSSAKEKHLQPAVPSESKPVAKTKPVGVTFVEAAIRPLHYELSERFWGWRPNDILNFTDNINNFQLGVLEVTRRTAVVLSERISRTGTNDALDPNLENAMNWFMIKADRYWFPSAESKFKEGLKELAKYKEKLIEGKASFYTRSDNLIPLLASFEDLLGSCDENLVKAFEDDGSPVSFFKADDYIYYTRGVASAMQDILEAVHHEFISILESRHGTELLHHAIESCRRAVEIDPIIVINSDLDGIFANHRANMAAPISHARFYLGQLIKTLST